MSFAAVPGGTDALGAVGLDEAEAPADDAGAEDYINRNTRIQRASIKERLEARTGAAVA